MLHRIDDYECGEGEGIDKYLAINGHFRGDGINGKERNRAIQHLKSEKKVVFVDWVATGYKIHRMDDLPSGNISTPFYLCFF